LLTWWILSALAVFDRFVFDGACGFGVRGEGSGRTGRVVFPGVLV